MSNAIFYNSKQDGDIKEPSTKGDSAIRFDFPTAERPLICKLVKDFYSGDSVVKLKYFKHMVGDSPKDTRYHISNDVLGNEVSPEQDYYWEIVHQMKALKDKDPSFQKGHPEYDRLFDLKKRFQSREAGYLFYIEPNSSEIKALKVGPMVFNRLFGREAKGTYAEVPSVIKEMQEKGMTPFLDADEDANKIGWVKIWKQGKELGTTYHIEPASTRKMVDVEGGGKAEQTQFSSYDLHKDIVAIIRGETELTANSFPNVKEFEAKQKWTLEECQELVKHEGGLAGTPERLLKSNSGSATKLDSGSYGAGASAEGSDTVEVGTTPAAPTEAPAINSDPKLNLDEIPF